MRIAMAAFGAVPAESPRRPAKRYASTSGGAARRRAARASLYSAGATRKPSFCAQPPKTYDVR